MKIEVSTNGQIIVTHENLTLIQTIIDGHRFNDCSIARNGYEELTNQDNPLFKDLFIALHSYKCE